MSRTPALTAMLLAAAIGTAADDWPVACHDTARSGIADSDSPGPSEAQIAWTAELEGSVDGSPIVVDDRIYVGCSTGKLFALNRADGSVLWSYQSGGTILGAPIAYNGRIYFGSADTFVYAVDAADGRRIWRHRTERPIIAAIVQVGDNVVFGSMDGSLHAANADTGGTVWRGAGHAGISAGIAERDGRIYYGDEDGNLYARQANDGVILWHSKLEGRIVGTPTIADDRLYVPLMSYSALTPPATEFLTGFDISDGNKVWVAEKPSGRSVFASPVRYQETVWAFCVEGYVSSGVLRAFNVDTAKQAFERKMGTLVVDADLAIAGDTLFIAAQDGHVYFANAANGTVEKKVRLGGKIYSSPAIAADRLYVGCQDGKLYCIK